MSNTISNEENSLADESIDQLLQRIRNLDLRTQIYTLFRQHVINCLSIDQPCDRTRRGPQSHEPQTQSSNTVQHECVNCNGTGSIQVSCLEAILRQRTKPKYFTPAQPGGAPNDCHWVCTLCTSKMLPVRQKSSEIARHLRDVHGFGQEDVKKVFDAKSRDALFEHFGPFSREDAQRNGMNVRDFPQPGARAKGKRPQGGIEPALPRLYSPKKKQLVKKLFSAVSQAKLPDRKTGQQEIVSLNGSTCCPTGSDLYLSDKQTTNGLAMNHKAPNQGICTDHDPMQMSAQFGVQFESPDIQPAQTKITGFDSIDPVSLRLDAEIPYCPTEGLGSNSFELFPNETSQELLDQYWQNVFPREC